MSQFEQTNDFDSNLEAAGSFGRVQFIIILLNCYVSAYAGWQGYIPVFATRQIDFFCADGSNSPSEPGFLKASYLFESTVSNGTPPYGEDCTKGCHKYTYESGISSVVSEYDLACGSNKFLPSLSISAYWAAHLMSCFISGALSDRFGRKYVSFILLLFLAIATSVTPFVTNIYMYIALRAVCGFCALNSGLDYIIMAEMISKTKLSTIGVTVQVIFVIGEFLCILFGYLFQDSWQWQFVAMAIPAYIYIMLHFLLMPESARWQHSQNKTKEAENNLKRIAKMNKRDPSAIHLNAVDQPFKSCKHHLPEAEPSEIIYDSQQLMLNDRSPTLDSVKTCERPNPNLLDLFGTFHSALLTLSSAASWFSCSLVYYGLTYDVQNINGNLFINALLLTLTEIPAWFSCVALNIFGRKKSFITSLFICSIACAVLPFTEPILDGKLQIVVAIIVKFLATGAFDMLYVYTPEQFPTQLRSTGQTFCSAAARIASISAPFIIDLKAGPYNCAPFTVFAICGVLTSITVQFVGVETKDKCFITTVKDYEQMAKSKQLKDLASDHQITCQDNVIHT